jgi:hypothetical protein
MPVAYYYRACGSGGGGGGGGYKKRFEDTSSDPFSKLTPLLSTFIKFFCVPGAV